MRKIICIAIICAVLILAGCDAPAKPTELIVSAAASLTDCMNELKTVYTAQHKNINITYNFGSSGSLQQQIEQGAPADVFLSASKKQMTELVEGGQIASETVKDILENKIVLITPKNGTAVASFEELEGSGIAKIAVGEPTSVPVGQYTEEIFENLGLSESLAPKLVFAKDVREVLSWVETGNVDAGVVYETDAKISDKVMVSCIAPEGSCKKVIYPVGVVGASKSYSEAGEFVEFLSTEQAKNIFIKYGFTPLV